MKHSIGHGASAVTCSVALTAALIWAGPAAAQAYPTKAVRVIVPQPPGGSTDLLARPLVQRMGEAMGQTVLVDNRSGAGSTIGTALAAQAAPDGYTLLIVAASFTSSPSVYKRLPYDPVRDFAPISQLTYVPSLLVVHPSLPVKSVKELIAFAKARPGQLDFGSSGVAGGTHMSMELLKYRTGMKLVHVPYRGGGFAVTSLISGEVQLMLATMPTVLPHVRSGKLRALGVSTERRSAVLPEVPTIAEAGVRDFNYASWLGFLAPGKTPQPIITRLHAEAVKALNSPEMKTLLARDASEIVGNSPSEFAAVIKREIAHWMEVTKAAGIKVN